MWSMIDVEIYAGLLLGYVVLSVALFHHRARREGTRQLLEAAVVLAAGWTLALGLLTVSTSDRWWAFVWQRTAQIGLVILALVSAELASAFVQRPLPRQNWRQAITLLCIVAALSMDMLASFPAFWIGSVRIGQTAPAGLILAAGWLALSATAAWTAAAALLRAIGAQHRNRIHYLLIALTLFIAGDVLIMLGRTPGTYAGLIMRLAGLGIVTIPVLRYYLPDIRRAILKGTHFGLVCLLAVALLVGSVVLFSYVWGDLTALLDEMTILIPALVLASAVAVAIGPRARLVLERALLGRDRALQKALRTYTQRIGLILDPEQLAEATLEWLEETFGIRRSAFILVTPRDGDQVELSVLCSRPFAAVTAHSFATGSRFLAHFDKTGRPINQYDLDMLDWFDVVSKDERQWLRELEVELYVPVLLARKLIALLALGPKAGGRPYTEQDREALLIMAGQTGTALDNARLVDDLRRAEGDLGQLGDQLDEATRQLEHLDQTKTDFLAIAAHELRTPLSQVYGYSDGLSSLKGEELGDAQAVHQYVQGISQGARRLKRVIDAMIDMSIIETGSLFLDPVTLPMGVAVKSATATVMSMAAERRIRLVVNDLSDLPYVQADSGRMEQALVALLSNAVKFTPDGGQITISGRHAPPAADQEWVELSIADSGIGIDPEEQKLIFGKFYRAENPLLHSTGETRFKGGGPGLGLAIAKGIVEAHGGRIWVESPGRDESSNPGSTFTVSLPVKQKAEE